MCISIVASAFQYGCPPTLMPMTMMFTSWPAWVNSISRRSTFAIQSMFSVPLAIEIFAPADSANHSSGTRIRSARSRAARMRAHSGSASEPTSLLGSPRTMTRVIPSGYFSVTFLIRPTTTFAVLWPYCRSTGTSWPSESRSCSTNSPGGRSPCAASAGGVSIRISSYG